MTSPIGWRPARRVLLNEREECRRDWEKLFGFVTTAAQQVRALRHLDAVATLQEAIDLEIDLTGDAKATGPLLDELLALLGLDDETIYAQWMAARKGDE